MNLPENKRKVPSLFVCQDGTPVTTADDWYGKRRSEILKIIQNEEYGVRPDMSDLQVRFNVTDVREGQDIINGTAIRKTIEVEAIRNGRNFIFTFVLFIPKDAVRPVAAFVEINNRGIMTCDPKRELLNSFYPVEMILSRGYACAAFRTQEVAPDYYEGYKNGFYRLYPELSEENRAGNAMSTISVWSWAASKVMDYLCMDPLVDETKVAVIGHSRGGKTSLLTAALDERFKMAISSCSGCSGDAIARGKNGEHISQITEVFPYWFCDNYKKYGNNEESMPFDQHFLTALIAPRLLYVSTKTRDSWADPISEFETLVQTDPVYQLLGEEGLQQREMPLPERPLHEGHIGYHQKTGEHNMDDYDWNLYLDFADKHMKS